MKPDLAAPRVEPFAFPPEFALNRIKEILADDANYQTDHLKLGGIWDWCEKAAAYRRSEDGRSIEVMHLKNDTAALDPLEDGRQPVTHEQALNSARRFIDEHFNNQPKYGRVKTCIPAQPDDDDILLTVYVKQQEARAARERELVTLLRKVKLLSRWDGPDAAPNRMHEIWQTVSTALDGIDLAEAALSDSQPQEKP